MTHARSLSIPRRHNTEWSTEDEAWSTTGAQRWLKSTLPGLRWKSGGGGSFIEESLLELRRRGLGEGCYGTIIPYLSWPLASPPAWPKPRWCLTSPHVAQYPPDFLKALSICPWVNKNREWTEHYGNRNGEAAQNSWMRTYWSRVQAPEWVWLRSERHFQLLDQSKAAFLVPIFLLCKLGTRATSRGLSED